MKSYAGCEINIDCIPGLPCNVCLTENDPDDPSDGPNQTGEPNEPKRGRSDACDSDFMNQIYGRAYLEAERQNVMGGLLLRKPDSVLEYSCFNQMASFAATVAAPIFTETHDWYETTNPEGRFDQGKQVLIWGEINKIDIDKADPLVGPDDDISDVQQVAPMVQFGKQYPVIMRVFMKDDRVDESIQRIVLESLTSYIEANFEHDFIGDTMSIDYKTREYEPDNEFYPLPDYSCPTMNQVYQWAKCVNFDQDDRFFSFESLANRDPRVLPAKCDHTNPDDKVDVEGALMGGDDAVGIGTNAGFQYAAFDPDNNIYDDLINGDCKPGIRTGITLTYTDDSVGGIVGNVIRGKPTQYEDLVCPNLGCSLTKPPSPKCER